MEWRSKLLSNDEGNNLYLMSRPYTIARTAFYLYVGGPYLSDRVLFCIRVAGSKRK